MFEFVSIAFLGGLYFRGRRMMMVEDCWWTIFVEDVEVGDVGDGKCLLKKKEELEKKSMLI